MIYVRSAFLWFIGILYFINFLAFALLVSLVFLPSKYDPWLKFLLRTFFNLLGTHVEIEGTDQIHPERTYIFMANHVSLFDIPLLGGFVPGFVRGIEARRQHQWLLYGWVMRRLGNIPIDRENIHQSISAINHTITIIQNGVSIIILPEGHRTLDGKLRQFKKLPFHMAKKANCEIIPIGLSGLFHLKRKGSWLIRPTKLKLKFGEIIPIETIHELSVIKLRDSVREKIQDLIERP